MISFSFVIGAVVHIISEPLTKQLPFLEYPADIFHQMLKNNELRTEDRELSQNEKMMMEKCIDIVRNDYELVNDCSEEFGRHDSGIIYQFLLNNVWVKGSTARIHATVRMMCRSLVFVSIGLIPISITLVWFISSGYISYSPIYKSITNNNLVFIAGHTLVLIFLSVGFSHGQKKYSTYMLFYMITEFVDPKEY
jgi:hypothetical protein